MRRQAAPALLPRPDDVEQGVIDTHRHSDQKHNCLDAVIEREQVTNRAQQPERSSDCGHRQQHGHSCGHERAEHDQQHQQRDRYGKLLGARQVLAGAAADVRDGFRNAPISSRGLAHDLPQLGG
jgi:hypothetical protein